MLTFSHIYNFPALSVEQNDAADLKSELRVANDVFWVRLCAMGDLGFAEAYMYGDVECDDLVSIFQVSIFIFVCAARVDHSCRCFCLIAKTYPT